MNPAPSARVGQAPIRTMWLRRARSWATTVVAAAAGLASTGMVSTWTTRRTSGGSSPTVSPTTIAVRPSTPWPLWTSAELLADLARRQHGAGAGLGRERDQPGAGVGAADVELGQQLGVVAGEVQGGVLAGRQGLEQGVGGGLARGVDGRIGRRQQHDCGHAGGDVGRGHHRLDALAAGGLEPRGRRPARGLGHDAGGHLDVQLEALACYDRIRITGTRAGGAASGAASGGTKSSARSRHTRPARPADTAPPSEPSSPTMVSRTAESVQVARGRAQAAGLRGRVTSSRPPGPCS